MEYKEHCGKCGAQQMEKLPKGKVAFRCMDRDAGPFYKRVLSVEREGADGAGVLRPAWCPRKGLGDG